MKKPLPWFCAHIVHYHKLKKSAQKRYLVWERIILIQAISRPAALRKAMRKGKALCDRSVTLGGRPASIEFGGVRKLMDCWDAPDDMVEVTYNEFWVEGKAMLKNLVSGKDAKVLNVVGGAQYPKQRRPRIA